VSSQTTVVHQTITSSNGCSLTFTKLNEYINEYLLFITRNTVKHSLNQRRWTITFFSVTNSFILYRPIWYFLLFIYIYCVTQVRSIVLVLLKKTYTPICKINFLFKAIYWFYNWLAYTNNLSRAVAHFFPWANTSSTVSLRLCFTDTVIANTLISWIYLLKFYLTD